MFIQNRDKRSAAELAGTGENLGELVDLKRGGAAFPITL